MENYWHEDCLKCGCCDCRLGEVGHSLYTKVSIIRYVVYIYNKKYQTI